MLDFRAVLPSKLKIAGNRFRLAGGRGDIGATLIRNLAGIFRRPESEHKNVNETYLEHKFGLDTSGLVRSPLLTPDGSPYYGSAPSLFNAIMRSLSINLANATFIDLGSGKGRALFLAAGLPFRRIVGVEIVPDLHRIAVKNAERFRRLFPGGPPIDLILGDASEYPIPDAPTVLYLYNPFGAGNMAKTIAGLDRAHRRTGRPIEIAYFHPILESMFDRQTWLRKSAVLELSLTPEEAARCILSRQIFRAALYSNF